MTKKLKQLTTVNYGSTVIYGRPGIGIFLHRNTGSPSRKEIMSTVNYGGAVIYGGAAIPKT
ncbi:hypothetical protein Hanom_Chr07g00627011 [Helianthus anomalus]